MPAQQPLQFEYHSTYNFASFYANGNQELIFQLQNFVDGKREQQIFIWGLKGQGKSHLLQACCNAAHQQQRNSFYINCSEAKLNLPDMLLGLENCALVSIDNIDAIVGNTPWEHAFFRFYNQHREQGNNLVIAASTPPTQLDFTLPDLKTRLTWGLCLKINPLDDEQLVSALIAKAHMMGLEITPKTGQYLLTRYTRDLPSLWTLLKKIDQKTLAAQRKPTIPLIKEILQQESN